jgi:hypothetical protein
VPARAATRSTSPVRRARDRSTFGPHAIGAERFPTVSSGRSFAQVAGAILRKRALGQNPDKDEVPGSSPGRPTNQPSRSERRGLGTSGARFAPGPHLVHVAAYSASSAAS